MNRDLGWRDAKGRGEERNREKTTAEDRAGVMASGGPGSGTEYPVPRGLGHFKAFGC